jgi:hypothetical protein
MNKMQEIQYSLAELKECLSEFYGEDNRLLEPLRPFSAQIQVMHSVIKHTLSILSSDDNPTLIEWVKYDRYSRNIESHKDHLVTDGLKVWIAQHAKLIKADGYGWHDQNNEPLNIAVTHWAKKVLP